MRAIAFMILGVLLLTSSASASVTEVKFELRDLNFEFRNTQGTINVEYTLPIELEGVKTAKPGDELEWEIIAKEGIVKITGNIVRTGKLIEIEAQIEKEQSLPLGREIEIPIPLAADIPIDLRLKFYYTARTSIESTVPVSPAHIDLDLVGSKDFKIEIPEDFKDKSVEITAPTQLDAKIDVIIEGIEVAEFTKSREGSPTPSESIEIVLPTTTTPTTVTTPVETIQTTTATTVETTPAETPKQPGFEAIFAIIGSLTVAYLLRR